MRAVSDRETIIDLSQVNFDHVVADIDEIRRYNAQRFEMEQLTAIVFEDPKKGICVGYKDVTDDDFWVRGHMPGSPLMPGVIMCEAAAQQCSYFACKHHLLDDKIMGLGGLEEVRFRDPVVPGARFVICTKVLKHRVGALVISRFECFVDGSPVCDGKIKGMPLPGDRWLRQ